MAYKVSIAQLVSFCLLALVLSRSRAQDARSGTPPSLAVAKSFESAALGKSVPFHLYLPAAYGENSEQRFPVVYWLHGSNGNSRVASMIVSRMYDRLIAGGKLPPTIVVFPDGMKDSMWVDSESGDVKMETFLVEELVPYMDAQFRTMAAPSGRLLEGGSMGGYGAARLGFKYPELFGAISMLSAGPLQHDLDPEEAPIVGRAHAAKVLQKTYGGDRSIFSQQSPWQLATELPDTVRNDIQLRMIVGATDPVLVYNEDFSAHLDQLDISHECDVLAGVDHSPRALFQALARHENYWRFNADFLVASGVK
ncbi:MAG: alpha/beta hydrolase-fold protein [Pseudomonadota bacterium]